MKCIKLFLSPLLLTLRLKYQTFSDSVKAPLLLHYRAFIVPHILEVFTINDGTLDLAALAVRVTQFEIASLVPRSWMHGVFLPLAHVI
jgi:hypothetical protein